jgi:hypothetical protein
VNIRKTEMPVNIEKMTAEINAMDNGKVYIVQEGRVLMYPLPAFGTMEIPCQNYKIGKPKYHISAD